MNMPDMGPARRTILVAVRAMVPVTQMPLKITEPIRAPCATAQFELCCWPVPSATTADNTTDRAEQSDCQGIGSTARLRS